MTDGWVSSALQRARAAELAVRAGALFHIARVAAWTDRDEGLRILDDAWTAARQLRGIERGEMAMLGWTVTAGVDPERVSATAMAEAGQWLRDGLTSVVQTLFDYGHGRLVAVLLLQIDEWDDFLFGSVTRAGSSCDDETRRALMRAAVERWRFARNRPHSARMFHRTFKWGWKYLGEGDARSVLREIVDEINTRDAGHATFAIDPEGKYVLHGRTGFLFDFIDTVQTLDPELADRVAAADPQLRWALDRYPRGMASVREEAERHMRERASGAGGRSYVMMGSGEDEFSFLQMLIDAETLDGYLRALEYPAEAYAKDADTRRPNVAPKEFWPSVNYYRQVLYQAGKRIGAPAAALLDTIADKDVRLLAEIEMVAAERGLPPAHLTSHSRPAWPGLPAVGAIAAPDTDIGEKTSDRGGGVTGPRIRCPKCKWQPREGDRWACTCGHIWNTFDTGGVCPGCMHQWKVTQCLECHQYSPHSDWYAED